MGTRAQRRAPSHRDQQRRRWPMAVLVIASGAAFVALLATLVSWRTAPEPVRAAGCPTAPVSLAVAAEIAEPVRDALAADGCSTVAVTATAPAEVVAALRGGRGPDYWVPDSSLAARGRTETLAPSLATTPLVVAADGMRPPRTWGGVLAAPGLVVGDPLSDAASALAIVLGQQGLEPEAALGALVPLAQRSVDARGTAAARDARRDRLGEGGITVLGEQQALAGDLDLSAPGGTSAYLDYPLLATGRPDDTTAAWLTRVLTSTAARARYVRAGFRTPGTADVTAPEEGVGHVERVEVSPEELAAAQRQWAVLAVPTRGLAVVDVSGSMDFTTPAGTRMDLTLAAARSGLQLFPRSAEIGLWAFSESLEGDQDHRELLPIRRLDAPVGGSTQLEVLDAELAGLPEITGGGTGLYDTTLAAYRRVSQAYRPGASHTVLLLTDGANDDPGSIGLPALVRRLEELSAEAPVRIIAIGISRDADEAALEAIAGATGGAAYVADQPEDIRSVFLAALSARVPAG